MPVYTEDALSAMTYRELQAIAKEFGVPANKKKDDLIVLIAEASAAPSSPEEGSVVAEIGNDDADVQVPQPTINIQLFASVPFMASEEVSKDAKTNMSIKEVDFDAEAPTEDGEDVFDKPIRKQNVQQDSAQTGASISSLIDSFSSAMRLQGLPTPQGKKTIFDAETPVTNGAGYRVNWGLSFQSPAGKKTPAQEGNSAFQTPCRDDEENCDPQYYEGYEDADDSWHISAQKPAPANSHVHFLSPEVKVGNQVHWRYEDYDLEAQCNVPPVPPSTAMKPEKSLTGASTPLTTSRKTLATTANKSAKKTPLLSNAAVPEIDPTASPQSRQSTLMSFWLSKGTPGKALFH